MRREISGGFSIIYSDDFNLIVVCENEAVRDKVVKLLNRHKEEEMEEGEIAEGGEGLSDDNGERKAVLAANVSAVQS